ncbi:hypothetical protein GCM10011380_04370 [Sphingomonas metalli]|uniref:Secreted protein n=1 Tax=Sphingomonas metalli TaxID=1779358 RepID=A0A916SWW3_9SPHN|nr:hypothetical protein [Sphingomonas metalli]GGB17950.1 hypothetical protein GCM10011380_04370 [Sphingomonas metalli]
MMMLLIALVTAAAMQAMPAPAPTAAPAARDKKICRRDTSIGSRLDVVKTCKTAAEWEAYNAAVARLENRRSDVTGSSGRIGRDR